MDIDPKTLIAAYQRKVAELQHENLILSAALETMMGEKQDETAPDPIDQEGLGDSGH